MTYEEAAKEWNKYIRCQAKSKSKECYLEYGFDCEKCGDEMEISIDLVRTSIEALEKQIPEKPIGDLHSVPHHRCPNCNGAVRLFEDDSYDAYCKFCGQAIDWSDDEYEAYQDEMGGMAEVVESEVE